MERAARIPYHLFDQSNDLGYRQKEAVGRFDRVADHLSKLILKADQLRAKMERETQSGTLRAAAHIEWQLVIH